MSFIDDYMSDLACLVNFDSGTSNPAGVTHAAQVAKTMFEKIGFVCELIDFGPEVGNGLLARNKPDAGYYDVFFNAHLDTVFPDGTAALHPLTIDGEYAHGAGCGDCKAGIVSILYALKNARREDLERLSICVCCNPDEETQSPFSRDWMSGHAKLSRFALICEGARPGGELVSSRKGACAYLAEFFGRTAHAGSNPQEGRDANLVAMTFAVAACNLNDYEKGTTISAGVISGGSAVNVISDYASIEFDTRFWWNDDHREFDRKMQDLAAVKWGSGVQVKLTVKGYTPAMPLTDATKDLVERIARAAHKAGFEARWIESGGASDANFIAEAGTAVVDGCGPICGDFHTEREWLRIDSIEPRVRMLSEFLSEI